MPLDTNGIWQYDETDNEATSSDLLNLLAASTSAAVGDLDDRVTVADEKSDAVAGILAATLAQTIQHNTATTLNVPLPLILAGGVTRVGSTLTAPVSGIYVVTSTVRWVSNNTGMRRLTLIRDPAASPPETLGVVETSAADASGAALNASAIYALVAGDVISAEVTQSSGGPLNTVASGIYPSLAIALVGRL